MKRLYYLFTIALFVACTNDEEMNLLTENLTEESVSVEKRSFQEALEVAQNAPKIFGGTTTRGELKQVTLARYSIYHQRCIYTKRCTRYLDVYIQL